MAVNNYATLADGVLAHEGGFTRAASDPGNWTGGAVGKGLLKGTKYGISAGAFPNEDIKNLTLDRARELYKSLYWDKVRGDELPAGIDCAVFDFAVNSGPSRAIIGLQRALGVADDGVLGPVTMAAAQKADPRRIVNAICDDRLAMMKRLKIWKIYGRGWSRRVADVRAKSLSLTGVKPSLIARALGR